MAESLNEKKKRKKDGQRPRKERKKRSKAEGLKRKKNEITKCLSMPKA